MPPLIFSDECLRSRLYSSIQAATRARACALVAKCSSPRSSNSSVLCQLSMTALTLLYSSSSLLILLWLAAEGAHEGPDLAGEQAFEAADDLGFGLAFGGAARDVGLGRLMVLHAHDHRSVERGVGLAVSAAVEPVPGRHPGGGGDR